MATKSEEAAQKLLALETQQAILLSLGLDPGNISNLKASITEKKGGQDHSAQQNNANTGSLNKAETAATAATDARRASADLSTATPEKVVAPIDMAISKLEFDKEVEKTIEELLQAEEEHAKTNSIAVARNSQVRGWALEERCLNLIKQNPKFAKELLASLESRAQEKLSAGLHGQYERLTTRYHKLEFLMYTKLNLKFADSTDTVSADSTESVKRESKEKENKHGKDGKENADASTGGPESNGVENDGWVMGSLLTDFGCNRETYAFLSATDKFNFLSQTLFKAYQQGFGMEIQPIIQAKMEKCADEWIIERLITVTEIPDLDATNIVEMQNQSPELILPFLESVLKDIEVFNVPKAYGRLKARIEQVISTVGQAGVAENLEPQPLLFMGPNGANVPAVNVQEINLNPIGHNPAVVPAPVAVDAVVEAVVGVEAVADVAATEEGTKKEADKSSASP